MEFGQHIVQRYDLELEAIRTKVLQMAGLVESQAENAVKALLEADDKLAAKVAKSDYKVNKMEVEIDTDCVRVIAKRQPAASDLRLVIAVIKVITDLERIGDEAEKIGKYAVKLASKNTDGMHAQLTNLSHLVLGMLHDSLDALAHLDDEKAMQIADMADQVNEEFNQVTRYILSYLKDDPNHIKSIFRISWCARSLERIGDHSRNISEYVIYLVKGKDIRHIDLDTVRAEIFDEVIAK